MIDIFIAIATIGSVIAGLWDFFTTEVPDEVPALMISTGLFLHLVNAILSNDFYPLSVSLVVGTLLLFVGLVMYKKGQWGGADAWILAAIGYLIPFYNGSLFIIDYISNFLIVSAAYMVVYAIIIGAKTPGIFSHFRSELKERLRLVIGIIASFGIFIVALVNFAALSAGSYSYIYNIERLFYMFFLVAFLTVFWVYGKVIEKYAFRKRIQTSRLKAGDVLEKMLWRGLTPEEVAKIKKSKKHVVIKEGVRFVPAFPITLFVTLLYGNVLFLLLL